MTVLEHLLETTKQFEQDTKKKPTLVIVSFEVFSKISKSLTDVKVDNNRMTGFYNNIEIRADKLCPDNVIVTRKPDPEELQIPDLLPVIPPFTGCYKKPKKKKNK